MKKKLVEHWKKLVRDRMALHFPIMKEHGLSGEEKKLFVPTALVFREELGNSKWGLCVFTADARDDDRILASVGWSFVEAFRPVKLRDGLTELRDGARFPRSSGAWGIDGIEILAGKNVSLGWRVDTDPQQFEASCSRALDETFEMLVAEVPAFFFRIRETTPD